MINISDVRPIVLKFASEMERVLKENDSKGGWQDCDINYLRFRLMEEIGEYFAWQASDTDACGDKITAEEWREKNKDRVKKELVDIANFCLMLWDRELR